MKISKKCQYALRAVFELAARNREIPVKAREIANSQRVSTRFLEIILNELKHSGFIESRRGNDGGYLLTRKPTELTVGEIIESIEGPISATPNKSLKKQTAYCFGDAAFGNLWQEATDKVAQVFLDKTFYDLMEYENNEKYKAMPNYCI